MKLALIVIALSVALVGGLFVFGVGQGWAASLGCGTASWYGSESGSRTASGEHFNPNGISAAMWGVPLGTRVRVTLQSTGRSIVVRINDRGPNKRLHRIIDLSRGAARVLGMGGLAKVCLEEVGNRPRSPT